jgi:hypothetical protein
MCLDYKYMNCHSLPPKKNLVPRFGRKIINGREANHPSKITENNHTREVKAVGICRDEYDKSMDRLYMDEF